MKSETDIPSLSDIGEWPRIEIGSHSVIRHAYENILTACARLGSFATGRERTTDGPISRQQEILAVDDLVSFAIHARRLIENTASSKRFMRVTLRAYRKPSETIAITRIINILVHHRDIEVIRNLFELELKTGLSSPIEALVKYGGKENEKFNKQFPPIVAIRSETNAFIVFELIELVETFQEKVLIPILDLCAEHHLFLDEDY